MLVVQCAWGPTGQTLATMPASPLPVPPGEGVEHAVPQGHTLQAPSPHTLQYMQAPLVHSQQQPTKHTSPANQSPNPPNTGIHGSGQVTATSAGCPQQDGQCRTSGDTYDNGEYGVGPTVYRHAPLHNSDKVNMSAGSPQPDPLAAGTWPPLATRWAGTWLPTSGTAWAGALSAGRIHVCLVFQFAASATL